MVKNKPKKYNIYTKKSCPDKYKLHSSYSNYREAIKNLNKLASKYIQAQLRVTYNER